ncbi:IS4/IS5 family transposase [Thermus thalpophilus]|uniref:IS4/IS5 family transposase n=1 Tax=Thermus thalpophilus TaxID=2908147 RepID=UPI001FAAF763|nr:IS4/IS5 family transposase [Thermus thalpophilus]
MSTLNPLHQIITAWVHNAFPSLRKTFRANLAQSRLNRLWRFLHHPALQNPWTLTAHLLPLLAPRVAQKGLLPLLVDWTHGEDGEHKVLVAALPLRGRALPLAFALHPLSPFPSQNRVEEAFLHRLGREVQALGYTPLFLLDRGFDRASLMRRLQEWGMGFLIRLRRNRGVETETGERFLLGERYPEVPEPQGLRARLVGSRGRGVEVGLWLFQGRREPWYLAFRDLKGGGLGLDRHRMRTGVSLGGWLWLVFLAMVVWVLLGAVLGGAEWWPQVVAYPERQSLFRLGWMALAQGPPRLRDEVARALRELLQGLLQRGGN